MVIAKSVTCSAVNKAKLPKFLTVAALCPAVQSLLDCSHGCDAAFCVVGKVSAFTISGKLLPMVGMYLCLFANIPCLGGLAEKFILHTITKYHVVSFAELHFICERNAVQERMFL